MKRIRIFDIDGTILHPGYDLWYLTTRTLCSDIESFERSILHWKKGIKAGSKGYEISKIMMLKGIDLMRHGITGDSILSCARLISINILQNGNYFEGALKHIDSSINNGFQVILSTTNYYEAGFGFLEAIAACGLIEKDKLDSILVSGTRVDWKNKELIHFNMGNNKIKEICELLDLTEQELMKNIDSFYCDDPEGNDRSLLNYPIKGFIIKNENNEKCSLPKNIILTDWDKVLQDHS